MNQPNYIALVSDDAETAGMIICEMEQIFSPALGLNQGVCFTLTGCPTIFGLMRRIRHRRETDRLVGRELARTRAFHGAFKQAACGIASA